MGILRPFCFTSLCSWYFGLSACRASTLPVLCRVASLAWHVLAACQEQTRGLPGHLVFWCSPWCQLGVLPGTVPAPSSSPAQLSCFRSFTSISPRSLAKDKPLAGVQHAIGAHGTALHSPDGALHQQIPMAVRVTATDEGMEEKHRDLAGPSANSLFTPQCCLPRRHI